MVVVVGWLGGWVVGGRFAPPWKRISFFLRLGLGTPAALVVVFFALRKSWGAVFGCSSRLAPFMPASGIPVHSTSTKSTFSVGL